VNVEVVVGVSVGVWVWLAVRDAVGVIELVKVAVWV